LIGLYDKGGQLVGYFDGFFTLSGSVTGGAMATYFGGRSWAESAGREILDTPISDNAALK